MTDTEIDTTTFSDTTERAASASEALGPLSGVTLPTLPLLAAAAIADPKDSGYRRLVHIHRAGERIRIVASDGQRLLVTASERVIDEPWPDWLAGGINLPAEGLVKRLKLLGDRCRLAAASGADSRAELTDLADRFLFRLTRASDSFGPYEAVIRGQCGAWLPGEPGSYRPATFDPGYIKAVGQLAGLLGARGVQVLSPDGDESEGKDGGRGAAVVLFPGVPDTVLYLQPLRCDTGAGVGARSILAPAIKASLSALKAHQTRARGELEAETDPARRNEIAARIHTYETRMAALRSNVAALPPPKPATAPAETSETAEASVSFGPSDINPPPAAEPETAPAAPPATPKARANGHAKPGKDPALSFDAWVKSVNKIVRQRKGVTLGDLPDVPTRDWHEAGLTPGQAASRAIEYAVRH